MTKHEHNSDQSAVKKNNANAPKVEQPETLPTQQGPMKQIQQTQFTPDRSTLTDAGVQQQGDNEPNESKGRPIEIEKSGPKPEPKFPTESQQR